MDRRGAGPMNATVFGRDAGEAFGVHLCTEPIYVRGAEPEDMIKVEILDIEPRPCANPLHSGEAFASNVSAWQGYQYNDLLGQQDRRDPDKREVVTIYESDLASPGAPYLPMDPADRPVRGAARNDRLSRRPGRSRRAAAPCQRPLDSLQFRSRKTPHFVGLAISS